MHNRTTVILSAREPFVFYAHQVAWTVRTNMYGIKRHLSEETEYVCVKLYL